MFPTVVHEATVRTFNYTVGTLNYHVEGQICQGVCCFRKFYRLVDTFSRRDRSHACIAAQALVREEEQAVITASDQEYKVWSEIRASAEPGAEGLDSQEPLNHFIT